MAEPIRVVRVITRLNIGGPAIQAISLSRTLAPRFSTLLVHGRLGPGEGDMRTIMPATNLDARYLPTMRRPVAPVDDLVTLWRLFVVFRRFRPQIVHTHMAKAGTLGRLAGVLYNRFAARGQRARLVHTYHGHVFEGYFGSITSRLFMTIERWLGRRTDALIAISPQVRADVVSTFRVGDEQRTRLIPLGFELDRFFAIDDDARARARHALGLGADDIVVTTVGRLTAIKQQSLFLDMAADVAGDPRATFLIVGDGELRQALEMQVEALGLGGRVRFLGWRGDLDVVYGATDIFVLTSRNEGTPVALIEAMAAGVAPVSTDVGGVGDVMSDAAAGLRVPFGHRPALTAAVAEFVGSETRRREAGAAARRAVRERFDLRRLTRDLTSLYEELLQQGWQKPVE
jgi:glycosyltransferase involved in cell wall biosynthesis